MEISLLLQVIYILVHIIICFIFISNCSNPKGKSFKPFKSKSKQKLNKSGTSINKKNISDSCMSKIKNVSGIKQISEVKALNEKQKNHMDGKTKFDKDKLKSITASQKNRSAGLTKQNKKCQDDTEGTKEYDEEIKKKLKTFLNIIKNNNNNNEDKNGSNQNLKLMKKDLKDNKNYSIKNISSYCIDSKNFKETKKLENKFKNEKKNAISNSFVNSKTFENVNSVITTKNKKKNPAKSIKTLKEKPNDCNNNTISKKKNLSIKSQEDERYINLVDLFVSEEVSNTYPVEMLLEDTQQSSSPTVDENKGEYENLTEDQINDEKYETLASIQNIHQLRNND
uniref:Uncharacterized protein n=1 Tax=Strongyloides stercoralis TaxID=6248 RepID=A0A0K0E969_STRER